MGRSIAFNRHDVLNKVLTLFWSRGFAASSLRQLETVTELNPGSLYYHFTNKEQLFHEALRHYVDNPLNARIDKNLTGGNPLEGIRRFLTSGYRHPRDEEFKNCCFLACACTDLPLLPQASTVALINTGMERIRAGFQRQLSRAHCSGILKSPRSPESLAHELTNLYLALQLLARINPNQKELDHTVKQSLYCLFHPELNAH